MPKAIYNKATGIYNAGGEGVEINSKAVINGESSGSLKATRNVTFHTSPSAGIVEVSGSLLQLKGRSEGIHFHIGGNQYVSNNSWFDANHPESGAGRWVYETTSGAAFRWGFLSSRGVFELDWAKSGTAGHVITGSSNATFGTGLSLSASNGAIGLGKRAHLGLSATLDITGSNPVSLAVTGSADIGGGAPDAYLIVPRLTSVQIGSLSARGGMLVYNTTSGKFQGYEDATSSWVNLA